jgi:enoyl-CoA hydratase/carnithine racemase
MVQKLDEALAEKDVTAVIITSTDTKYWSLGVDIDWLGKQLQAQAFQNIKDFMYGMNEVFKKLLLLPVPAIAAINGHAFGNGAILSCACDFRFMRSDKGFFCFPEVDLGIPFLPGMTAFVKKAIPYYKFNELKLTGRKASAAELETHHVIQKASANADELMKDVSAFAKTFQKKRGIFKELKKRMHKEIIRIIEQEDPEYIESLFLMVQE